MLYTKQGDKGTTKFFCCEQGFLKSSAIAEALGDVDELNSFLGLCKTKTSELRGSTPKLDLVKITEDIQQNLFIIQAQIAGADKKINEEKIKEMEVVIDGIEKELPEIKTFFVSGGTEISAMFDVARTVARRAERRVVEVKETASVTGYGESRENKINIDDNTLIYLNRLSSLLYAIARHCNHISGINEVAPSYK